MWRGTDAWHLASGGIQITLSYSLLFKAMIVFPPDLLYVFGQEANHPRTPVILANFARSAAFL